MNWLERRSIRRLERRAAGIRTPMEFPVPQPTTPLSSNVVPFTFDDYQLAKHGVGHPAVLKLFRTFGAYRVKPKRGSVGVIWINRAFWWSEKGYYRPGKSSGPRRPLQHLIWEQFHGRKMPRGHEIFFCDRNRHNFSRANMDCISKAELHRRVLYLGESYTLSFAERSKIAMRRWTNQSRSSVSALLNNSNSPIINLRRTKCSQI